MVQQVCRAAAWVCAIGLLTGCTGLTTGTVAPPASSRPAPTLTPTTSATPEGHALRGADGTGSLPGVVVPPIPAHTVAVVLDAATGAVLLDQGAVAPTPPASTVKLLTATAALEVLGPDLRLRTRVLASGAITNGVLHGDLVLVGAGDPTLSAGPTPALSGAATLPMLVSGVRAAGIRRVTGGVLADTSLFTGPSLAAGWEPRYVTGGSVSPVSSLEVDAGRLRPLEEFSPRVPDAPLAAAAELTRQLRLAGIVVTRLAAHGVGKGREVAHANSAPLRAIIKKMLQDSDNDIAECLARLMSLQVGGKPDFAGGAAAVMSAVPMALPSAQLHDASGLSRLDRVLPITLAQLVRLAVGPDRPELRLISDDLPVSGRSGSLAKRFLTGPEAAAIGEVHAKTGRLSDVVALAGWTRTRGGRILCFAFITQRVTSPVAAEGGLDRAAAYLAGLA